MPIALLILALLIGATPAILLVDGPIVHGVVAAAAAAGLAAVARGIRPGEAGHLIPLVRPLAVVAAIPAVWMAIQALPLSSIGLSHPIWQSAQAALGRPLGGSISIDTGATLMVLSRYLSIVAIVLVAAAVAVDRQRAVLILYLLVAATAVAAVMVGGHDLAGVPPLDTAAREEGLAGAALGTVLAAAAGLRAWERHENRRATAGAAAGGFAPALSASLAGFAVCAATILWGAAGEVALAAAYGLAALAAVVVIRRFGLGPWGASAIAATALVISIAIVASRPGIGAVDPTLALAAHAPAALVAVTQRILTDAPWSGAGAGTFAALLPIYRDVGDAATGSAPPTTAAAIAVELGRPMLWVIAIAAIGAIAALLQGALGRGRDSFYPAAGAGCLATLVLLAFANAAVPATAVMIIAASALGLALAQSRSRTIQ